MSVPVKLKSRLKTIRNLNAIFNALQVITTARMQKVRSLHKSSHHHLVALEDAARHLDLSRFSLTPASNKSTAILISGNRGLCGSFNQNLFWRANSFIKEQAALQNDVEFIVFGKRGHSFLKTKGLAVRQFFASEDVSPKVFRSIAKELLASFLSGSTSEAHVIANRYRSVVKQEALVHRLFPLEVSPVRDDSYFILEPDESAAVHEVVERLVTSKLFHYYIDSTLGELSSRLFTLKGAIENSKELMENLALDLNKIRQQSITGELLEIISSSECLAAGRC
jgi:F-type H+-transporting ATPase subunit gamma